MASPLARWRRDPRSRQTAVPIARWYSRAGPPGCVGCAAMNRNILAGVLIVVAGCSKKDSGSAKVTEGSATEPVKEKPKAPEASTVKIDPEIDKRVKAIVANCRVDTENI